MDARVASNAESGLWREFGVDANGNARVTENYGLDRAGTPITTFTVYNGRNREVARFAAETTQHDGGSARAVTRFEYDVQNNLVKEIDANGGETSRTWNALGRQLSETDPLANTTTYHYDRLGRRTAE
uniref:RHS repeat domain-containing protein n=1 Tax=Sedimenticola hydrogenitrophicus TaxID=2967975 RepID=UPI0021A458A5